MMNREKKECILPRTVARLAAVQFCFAGESVKAIAVEDFKSHFFVRENGYDVFGDGHVYMLDLSYFMSIIQGVQEKRTVLCEAIDEALSGTRNIGVLEDVTRAILLCGTWELFFRQDTPLKVVLNEYIDIGHALLPEGWCGFVNGVLDKLKERRVSWAAPEVCTDSPEKR